MKRELNKKIMSAAEDYIDAYLDQAGGVHVLDRDDLTWLVHDALLAGWFDRPLDWNTYRNVESDNPVAPSVLHETNETDGRDYRLDWQEEE